MKLRTTILLYGGGPGSGCNPEVGKCGRPSSGSEPVRHQKAYHGGTFHHGERAFYWTPNREMAESYVQMYNERFGGGGQVLDGTIDIDHPAPHDVIQQEAQKLRIDNSNYTPASIFDSNLHGTEKVDKLVQRLMKAGYDGAVLDDVAYGKELQDKAYILFSK